MDPEVIRLATDLALAEAVHDIGAPPGFAPAVRALLREELGGRVRVSEGTFSGEYRVAVSSESGETPVGTYVRAWAQLPAQAHLFSKPAPHSKGQRTMNQIDMETPNTRVHLFTRIPDEVENPDLVAMTASVADSLEGELVGLSERLRKIGQDFRPEAQGRERERVGAATAERITALLDATLAPIHRTVEAAEHELLSPGFRHAIPSGAAADDWRASEAEARGQIRALDPLERETLYIEAARRGDRQTLRAFELAPSAFPLVSEEKVAEAAELFAAAVAPDRYRALSEARTVRAFIEGNVVRASEALRGLTGTVRVDPVAVAAAGTE